MLFTSIKRMYISPVFFNTLFITKYSYYIYSKHFNHQNENFLIFDVYDGFYNNNATVYEAK